MQLHEEKREKEEKQDRMREGEKDWKRKEGRKQGRMERKCKYYYLSITLLNFESFQLRIPKLSSKPWKQRISDDITNEYN